MLATKPTRDQLSRIIKAFQSAAETITTPEQADELTEVLSAADVLNANLPEPAVAAYVRALDAAAKGYILTFKEDAATFARKALAALGSDTSDTALSVAEKAFADAVPVHDLPLGERSPGAALQYSSGFLKRSDGARLDDPAVYGGADHAPRGRAERAMHDDLRQLAKTYQHSLRRAGKLGQLWQEALEAPPESIDGDMYESMRRQLHGLLIRDRGWGLPSMEGR